MDTSKLDNLAKQILEAAPSDKDRAAIEKILHGLVQLLRGTPEAAQQTDEFLQNTKDPKEIADGVLANLLLMSQKAKGGFPWGPAIAAGQIMLLEGLLEAQDAGNIKVTDQVVADTTKYFVDRVLEKLGVSADQLVAMTHKVSAVQTAAPSLAQGG